MIQPGALIDDRYELRTLLGEGAAAKVFRGFDRRLEREVALKFLTGRSALAAPARFLEEARSLAEVRHPHVLQVLEFGVFHDVPYLVLELAHGGSLADRLKEGPLDPEEAHALATEILEALQATHEAGVLHRDLKPANVLLTRAGRAKIADFGLAKRAESGVRTRSGLILGTPEFMAPEVMHGERATVGSDVFSWGCLAYTLANGRPPFTGSIAEIARSHTGPLAPRGREAGPLASAIRAALSIDPKGRATVASLLEILSGRARTGRVDLLETVAASREIPEAPAPVAPAVSRLSLVYLLLGVVVLGGAVLAYQLLATRSQKAARREYEEQRRASRLELVERWTRTLSRSHYEARLPDLHTEIIEKTGGVSLFYQPFPKLMFDARDGRADLVDLEPLDRAREELPARADFLLARKELAACLADPDLPREARRRLWDQVLSLRRVDAYFEAWGRLPPYGARHVLAPLFPQESFDRDRRDRPDSRPEAAGIAPGETRLLFEWEDPKDLTYPSLYVKGTTGSLFEDVGSRMFREVEKSGVDLSKHRQIQLQVRLAEEVRGGVLLLALADTVVPYFLRIEWDGWPIEYHAEPNRSPSWQWMDKRGHDFLLEIALPREFATPGAHRVLVRLRNPPGIQRMGVMGVDWIALEAQ